MATDATAASTQKLLDKEREKHRASKRAAKLAKGSALPSLAHDEFVVYSEDQVKIRFLAKVKVSPATN